MKQTVEKLIEILKQELNVYNSLLQLAKKKRQLLLEKFSTELQDIVSKEELLIQDLIELEPKRIDLVARISGNSKSNLDEVIETVAENDGKSDLWMVGSQLKDVAKAIRDTNEENRKLLEQALELTQYSIQLITKAPTDSTYSPNGKKYGKRPPTSIFDRKI